MDIGHAMVLLFDPARQTLYTLASNGYVQSGVGAEIDLGKGVIAQVRRLRPAISV